MLCLIIRYTMGSTNDSNTLSFPVNPCTFCLYKIPIAGQVSLGLLSLSVDSEWRGSTILVMLVFMGLFDGRMDVSYCCLDSLSSNPRSVPESSLLASSMICRINGLGVLRSSWASVMRLTCLIFPFRDLDHDAVLNWTERGFIRKTQ